MEWLNPLKCKTEQLNVSANELRCVCVCVCGVCVGVGVGLGLEWGWMCVCVCVCLRENTAPTILLIVNPNNLTLIL